MADRVAKTSGFLPICGGLGWCLLHAVAVHAEPVTTPAALPDDLKEISLESLTNIQVTSVSKRAENLSGAAAADRPLSGIVMAKSVGFLV